MGLFGHDQAAVLDGGLPKWKSENRALEKGAPAPKAAHFVSHPVAGQVRPGQAGQPQVDWSVTYRERASGQKRTVEGHVEVRWSHGRFAQPPEAKIYLDTPTDEIPGYFALSEAPDQPRLWN